MSIRWAAALALGIAMAAGATTPAERLMYAGNLAAALPAARDEAEAAPADLDAQERYIDALLSMGLLGTADAAYRARVEASPTAESWYLFGRVLVEPEEADRAYANALAAQPGMARALMGRASVARAQGRLDEAVSGYQAALSADATLGEAWSGLTATFLLAHQPEEALATARRAMSTLPGDSDAYLTAASLAPDEAVAMLSMGAVRAPSDPRVHASLAEAYLDRDNGAGALIAAEHALELSPAFADPALSKMFALEMVAGTLDADGYHRLMATRLTEADAPFEAIAAYAELVERYPRSPLPLMARARVRAGQGDTDGAVTDLAHAMGVDPGNQEAQAALGLVLIQAERFSDARGVLERVVAHRQGDTALAIALARAQQADGDHAAAIATMEAVRTLRPLHVLAALEHARLLSDGGDSLGAYAVLLKITGEVPDERLVLALAAAALDTGRLREAADLMDLLARSTRNDQFAAVAARMRSH